MSKGLTRRHLRRTNALFYGLYVLVVLVICAVASYYLRELWSFLVDYEAAQTKYVLSDVVDLVEKRDFAALLEYEGEVPYADLAEEYAAYMNGQMDGEVTSRTVYTGDAQGSLVFNLYSGDKRLYKATITPTGEVNGHGFALWSLTKVENYTIAYATYEIQAPQTSKVYADGVLLGSDAIVERGIETGVEEHLLPEILPPTQVVYRLETYFGEPVFRVVDSRGREQPLEETESGRRVASTLYDDEALRPEMEKQVMSLSQAFARFTIGDASAASMLKLTYPDSSAYTYVRKFDTSWFFATFGNSFSNGRTEHYIQYREDYVSCDVYFDFTVKYRQETRTYHSAYTMYFKKNGDQWLLYDIVTR